MKAFPMLPFSPITIIIIILIGLGDGSVPDHDCTTHLSCSECVSPSNPCEWCLFANRCTDNATLNCRNEVLVTGIDHSRPDSHLSGPEFCPSIGTIRDKTEIIATSGASTKIVVKINIPIPAIVESGLICQFIVEENVINVNGHWRGDRVYCDYVQFNYKSNAPNVTAIFNILRNGRIPLDNPNNIHVAIYRCGDPSDGCDKCLNLRDRLNCGWCQSKVQCNVHEQCDPFDEKANGWLTNGQSTKCPKQ